MKILTIAGVGPGDPSLVTLAAVNAIKESTVVSYPVSRKGGESFAAKIASKWITSDKKKLPLYFPMVFDQETLKASWRNAGNELMLMVDKGEKVIFIAQGDISHFSTGSYLYMELERNYPECVVKLIPGITSFSAAAAKAKLPLVIQEEQLLILSVPESSFELKTILVEAAEKRRTVVLLKVGKKWIWVKPLLQELELLENSIFAENVGLLDEQVAGASDLSLSSKPYFSLLVIRQTWPLIRH
tara:strand:- start:9518 stop:10246 length:729 start_codon:yes stop_codon:yes gene_type:complete